MATNVSQVSICQSAHCDIMQDLFFCIHFLLKCVFIAPMPATASVATTPVPGKWNCGYDLNRFGDLQTELDTQPF